MKDVGTAGGCMQRGPELSLALLLHSPLWSDIAVTPVHTCWGGAWAQHKAALELWWKSCAAAEETECVVTVLTQRGLTPPGTDVTPVETGGAAGGIAKGLLVNTVPAEFSFLLNLL